MAQRFEGKSLEDALEIAGTALGLQRYELSYRVLLEKRGFLGGTKRVVIEAEKNESATPPHERSSFGFDLSGRDVPAAPPRERQRGGSSGGGRRGDRGRGNDRAGRRERHGRGDRRNERTFSDNFADDTPVEVPPQEEQSPLAKEVSSWFAEVVRLAQLDIEVRTTESADTINVQMYGPDSRRLTDRGGELMDAFQVIANKAFGRREGAKDIECNSRNYKEHRENELQEQARRVAELVRRDGREHMLPAMSPVERRIVHVTLAEEADVMTESRGDGFFKRVAIVPRSPQPAAEP